MYKLNFHLLRRIPAPPSAVFSSVESAAVRDDQGAEGDRPKGENLLDPFLFSSPSFALIRPLHIKPSPLAV